MNFPDSPFILPEGWHYTGPFQQSKIVTDSVERLQTTVMKMIHDDRQRQEATFNAVLAAVIQKYLPNTFEIRLLPSAISALENRIKINHTYDDQTGEHVFRLQLVSEGPSYDDLCPESAWKEDGWTEIKTEQVQTPAP